MRDIRYKAKKKKDRETAVRNGFITKVNTTNAVDLACIENDCRDDGGTMNKSTLVRENIEGGIQMNRDTIKSYGGNIFLNHDGEYMKFIDVPGDGDCFYHSVLKYNNLSETFNGVHHLRHYLRDTVSQLYYNDPLLQRLFFKERQDFSLWCSKITRMGVWVM